jgi:hypothetical protein
MTHCYFCARESSSKEHVPPKSFFDTGFNLVTVPSCEDHNSSRSKDDEYIRLIVAGQAWQHVPSAVRSKILKSAKRGRGPAPKVHSSLYSHAGTDGHYNVDVERLELCAESMARAIIFHKFGLRHPTNRRPEVTLHFVECTFDAPEEIVSRYASLKMMALNLMAAVPFEGQQPNIFKYKPNPTCVQLCFYTSCNITVSF